MKKSILLTSVIFLLTSTISLAASLQSLNQSQSTRALQGKTITTVPLITLNGDLVDNSFSGYFDKSGQLQGQLSNKPINDPQNDAGRWEIKTNGALCATWQHWNHAKPICVYIYKLANGLLFISEQSKKIETLILNDNIKAGNHIN